MVWPTMESAIDNAHVAIGTNEPFAMSRAYNALAELLPQKESSRSVNQKEGS